MTEIEPVVQPYRVLNDVRRKSVTFVRMGGCVHSPIVAQRELTWQYQSESCARVSGRGEPGQLRVSRRSRH